jgi:hypothetical protein|tara:strand:+ start:190 stop:621 length:432 start_codon:yes stop_codon:yes gene_type:complete
MPKELKFKDFLSVDLMPGATDQEKSNAKKRKTYDEEAVELEAEALNMQTRRKRGMDMRKNKNKLAISRKRAMNRVANPERIKKRAKKQAMRDIYKKLTKGVSKDKLTPAKKAELEKRVARMKPRVNRMAKKLMPTVRARAHRK